MPTRSLTPTRRLRFAGFELNRLTGELHREGERVRLQEQPLQILLALLERPGELVTREALRERLWPNGTFVDFERGLNSAVMRLRDALGDSAEEPKLVETLPRRGYRFLGEVEEADARRPESGSPAPGRKAGVGSRVWLASLVALALLAALMGWGGAGKKSTRGPAPVRSVAVLPFADLSAETGQEYFADGMTDQLILELGKLSELRVIARQSVVAYKGSERTAGEIAGELGVDGLIEGTVLRSGQQVRINVKLIRAADNTQLWQASYDGSAGEAMALHAQVARSVAQAIGVALSPAAERLRAAAPPVSPEAYDIYLRGRYHLNRLSPDDLRRSAELFREAAEKEPSFAQAHAALAKSYAFLAAMGVMPTADARIEAEAAVRRALELDDTLAEAHAVQGQLKAEYEWDWPGAEQELGRALALNASYPDTLILYARLLNATGRHPQALAVLRRARELNPLSPFLDAHVVFTYFCSRQYDRALEEVRAALADNPDSWWWHRLEGQIQAALGEYREAIDAFEKALAAQPGDASTLALLGQAYGLAGEKNKSREALRQLQRRAPQRELSPENLALIYAGLGETDEALTWLEKAYAQRARSLLWLKTDPTYDSLRGTARFQALLSRMNFPSWPERAGAAHP